MEAGDPSCGLDHSHRLARSISHCNVHDAHTTMENFEHKPALTCPWIGMRPETPGPETRIVAENAIIQSDFVPNPSAMAKRIMVSASFIFHKYPAFAPVCKPAGNGLVGKSAHHSRQFAIEHRQRRGKRGVIFKRSRQPLSQR